MKNDNNNLLRFVAGMALAIAGLGMLLMNIDVMTFAFYRVGGVDSAVILLFFLAVLVIWGVISDKRLPWLLVVADVILIVVSVLMGTRFVFKRMNVLILIAIVVMIAVGVALMIMGAVGVSRRK